MFSLDVRLGSHKETKRPWFKTQTPQGERISDGAALDLTRLESEMDGQEEIALVNKVTLNINANDEKFDVAMAA